LEPPLNLSTRGLVGGRTVHSTAAPRPDGATGERYEGPYWSRLLEAIGTSDISPTIPILRVRAGDVRHEEVPSLVDSVGVPLVLLYGSDESGVPIDISHPGVLAVGQTYAGAAVLSRGHVALPPGAMDGRFFDSLPETRRDIDVLFLGKVYRRRSSILGQLGRPVDPRSWIHRYAGGTQRSSSRLRRFVSRVARLPATAPRLATGRNNLIKVSGRWGGSITGAEYRALLGRTKVALCMPGWSSPETFRHFEAASAGCHVVSAPLPDSWVYRDHPFFIAERIEDWPHVVAEALAAADDPQASRHDATRRFWENRLSPEAAGGILGRELGKLLRGPTGP